MRDPRRKLFFLFFLKKRKRHAFSPKPALPQSCALHNCNAEREWENVCVGERQTGGQRRERQGENKTGKDIISGEGVGNRGGG